MIKQIHSRLWLVRRRYVIQYFNLVHEEKQRKEIEPNYYLIATTHSNALCMTRKFWFISQNVMQMSNVSFANKRTLGKKWFLEVDQWLRFATL